MSLNHNHNHNHETTTAPPVSRILCCALRRTLTHTRTVAHTVRSTCACYRVARAARHSSDGSAGGREHGERLISRRQRLAIVVIGELQKPSLPAWVWVFIVATDEVTNPLSRSFMDRARDSPDSRIPCNNSDYNAARVLEEHLTTTNPSPLGVMYTLHPQCHIPEATCLPINSTYPFFNCHAHSFYPRSIRRPPAHPIPPFGPSLGVQLSLSLRLTPHTPDRLPSPVTTYLPPSRTAHYPTGVNLPRPPTQPTLPPPASTPACKDEPILPRVSLWLRAGQVPGQPVRSSAANTGPMRTTIPPLSLSPCRMQSQRPDRPMPVQGSSFRELPGHTHSLHRSLRMAVWPHPWHVVP
ncbi:hypothetical protein PCL_11468 [Purpureocillium lilacinum]|uniref:Uncharacterized protein n=1 Tax=Purpureocillium lilacinum TaxID=33203 RepID=A0A2U3EA51_PURLI|nr:hypothetical protein PCL_11468 [Purpureocillium lilacinum]